MAEGAPRIRFRHRAEYVALAFAGAIVRWAPHRVSLALAWGVAAVMHELADIELKEFFANVAPHVGELEAVDMAERGIGILNQLMAELFTREVLALLSERRRIANDNRSAEARGAGQA